ncbi:response regulator [Candidatus Collierbacteria bacterium]|nr:response regulator [Candidatus Collierbacteria bacterium]
MKKILIVEDDASLLKAYQEMFKPEEFRIVGATTGQEGLTLVSSEKPDVILLDIMLPGGMNGFDVLEQLESNPLTKNIPVIVLTNLDSEEKVAKTIGARYYIVKANTTKDQIVKLVGNCLGS